MKLRSVFAVILAFVAVAAMTAPAAGAGKPKPIAIDKFNDTFEDMYLADDVSSACGVDVSATVNPKGRVRIYVDGEDGHYVEGHVSVRTTFENEATGEQVISFWSDNFSDSFSANIEGDIGTFSGEHSQNGLFNLYRAPGHGVIAREAGQINFSFIDVVNLETGETIYFEETVEFVGPHPLSETMGLSDEDNAALCSALGGSFQP